MSQERRAQLLRQLRKAVQVMDSSVCGLGGVYGIKMARKLSLLLDRFENDHENAVVEEIREIFRNINGGIMKADLEIFVGLDRQVLEWINQQLFEVEKSED